MLKVRGGYARLVKSAIERDSSSNSPEILTDYKDNIQCLIGVCQSVLIKWEEMVDTIDLRSRLLRYRAPTLESDAMRRGPSRFCHLKGTIVIFVINVIQLE